MKSVLYSVITVLISSVNLFAQDVIQFNNGKSQNGKIVEVRQNEIVYQKSEIPNGPNYTSNKSDISYIQFANGYKEVFTIQSVNGNSVQAQTYVNPQAQQQTQAAPNTYQSNTYYVQPSQPAIVPYVAPAPVFVPIVRYNNYGPGWGYGGGWYGGGWGYGGGYHHGGGWGYGGGYHGGGHHR